MVEQKKLKLKARKMLKILLKKCTMRIYVEKIDEKKLYLQVDTNDIFLRNKNY